MNDSLQPSAKATHLTLGGIIAWLFSIGLLFSGLMSLFTNFGMGLVIILAGLVFFPPMTKYLKEKHNFSISTPLKIVLLFGIIMMGGYLISQDNDTAPAAVTETRPSVAYDVPSLVGLSLTEIREKLGTPSYDTEPNEQQIYLGVDTWEKSWDLGEYSIMATYDFKTKKVVDLFFGADTDAAFEQFKDTGNILAAGGLSTSDPKYSVEFVKAKNAPGYTGAIIRAK